MTDLVNITIKTFTDGRIFNEKIFDYPHGRLESIDSEVNRQDTSNYVDSQVECACLNNYLSTSMSVHTTVHIDGISFGA